MENMAASSKARNSEEAEANANEAMDANSSEVGLGEKYMETSSANSRESTENSMSSPGRSDGDDREQLSAEQSEDLATDEWVGKNAESSADADRAELSGGPVAVALQDHQSHIDLDQDNAQNMEVRYQADSNFNEGVCGAGCNSGNPKEVDIGETELDAPGALLYGSFIGRSGPTTKLSGALESSETVNEDLSNKHQTKNSPYEPFADLPMNNVSGQPVGPPRIIHTDINPRLVAPVSSGGGASSTGSGSIQLKTKTSAALRRGKWTVEEEAYVARVIQDFNSGFLDAPAGTTLRSYLSEKLHCDPMRITKKFTGDACIGKRVFHPAVRCAANAAGIDKAQAELNALERRWRRRLEMQQRESAKKAAASAAAYAAGKGPGSVGTPTLRPSGSSSSLQQQVQQSVVARTASWLDRANSILQGNDGLTQSVTTSEPGVDPGFPLPKSEIMNQMKEVQRLIYEGPIIQQTTAGIAGILDNDVSPQPFASKSNDTEDPDFPVESKQVVEPADKRMRRTSMNSSGAEDAEALVGFLRSVRASAASEEFSN